jgi:predicted GTPase
MEWSPPYSWENPRRPKEQNIRSAIEYTRQTFADRLQSIVPVCTDRENGRVFGIEEYLLPTLSLYLDEARACSLVRSIHRDYEQQRVWQVVNQLVSAGSKIRESLPALSKENLQQAAKSILSSVLKK